MNYKIIGIAAVSFGVWSFLDEVNRKDEGEYSNRKVFVIHAIFAIIFGFALIIWAD